MDLDPRPKVVHVRDYLRTRFGHQENVRQHWRRLPRQLTLPF
jgi:hypothetical protein